MSEPRYPNESRAYRDAREALLKDEQELVDKTKALAAKRRALPPGGELKEDYVFQWAGGGNVGHKVKFSDLFGDKDTLVVYSYMFGPKRATPCPMCTSFMNTWEGKLPDVEQRVAFVFMARSPIDRLVAAKKARGWSWIRVVSDTDGDYTRAYVSREDADVPAYNVFTRRDGTIRHFWASEMYASSADPGQDPRGAPDLDPLWTLLDTTPHGRGQDWYPKLSYT